MVSRLDLGAFCAIVCRDNTSTVMSLLAYVGFGGFALRGISVRVLVCWLKKPAL